MDDTERFKLLHGPYRAPRCQLGKKVFCEVRGWVAVHGVSAGRIPWPRTKVKRAWAFILCGDLAEAVRRESAIAVCHWWGVTAQTVTAWRKALDVPQVNEGTARLYHDYAPERLPPEVQERARAKAHAPEARAKLSATKKGQPTHPNLLAASRFRGKKHALDSRRKMSASHRRRGTRPPKAGKPWTAEEDALLGTLTDAEVVRRTGRTLEAVQSRRYVKEITRFYD